MITVTSLAATHLARMVDARLQEGGREAEGKLGPEGSQDAMHGMERRGRMGLRIIVEKGGCAGMQYTMQLDAEAPGDQVSEAGGALVLVDPASAAFTDGSELDYCDDLVGTGFRLHNPRASRSCGCGTSFEPIPAEASSETSPHASSVRPMGGGEGALSMGSAEGEPQS
jgi:iron-sulfur cluster assembly accessory protein